MLEFLITIEKQQIKFVLQQVQQLDYLLKLIQLLWITIVSQKINLGYSFIKIMKKLRILIISKS
ncbi:367L [Invertebrate iridescent virus Kaz2018]|uniref:367L n=1 Tax=Invertebrate iridescent virus 6 TaxID=176652 RepID=Q91FF7_IIV6|nr:367L [Invertebrate iridescent virus 6]AAK82227.1 367L [Invertebrate iridescent virus 6]QMS79614.1 hypothetical protein IIV6-T1_360 [Invertebrate iridescent virus 6]QNH08777.1 367L [Invertebrate iridescent virus Kaz2018]